MVLDFGHGFDGRPCGHVSPLGAPRTSELQVQTKQDFGYGPGLTSQDSGDLLVKMTNSDSGDGAGLTYQDSRGRAGLTNQDSGWGKADYAGLWA